MDYEDRYMHIYTQWNTTNSSSIGNGKELKPLKPVVITTNQAFSWKKYKPTLHVFPSDGWETGDEQPECITSLQLSYP